MLSSRFHICGQATSPEQLTTINAEGGNTGFIKKQRERLYDKRLRPELEALFSDSPDAERRQMSQSPMLEMVADLSRSPALKHGTKVVLISDLAQNSDSVQFCRVKNDMPPFSIFKQKRVYQDSLKPQSFEGVEVDILMLQRSRYGPYCRDEDEIRRFWVDYFRANGVKSPHVIRIRHGMGK